MTYLYKKQLPAEEFYNNSSHHNGSHQVTPSHQRWRPSSSGVDKLFGTGMTDEGWWLQLQEYLLRLSTKKQGLDTSGFPVGGWCAGDLGVLLLVAGLEVLFLWQEWRLRSRKYVDIFLFCLKSCDFGFWNICRMFYWIYNLTKTVWADIGCPCAMYHVQIDIWTSQPFINSIR